MTVSKKPRKLTKPNVPIPKMPMPKMPTSFSVKPWRTDAGEKIIIYADTGMGKSSLARLAPRPVWLGLDDGASKLKKPGTNDPLDRIPDIYTFSDVREVLQQVDLYNDFDTIVVDHTTILEDWAGTHVVNTIPMAKGARVSNIEAYGWKEGYRHLYDVMRGPLADCDELVRRGKNVILIAQLTTHKVSHPGGAESFLRAGPRLYSGYPISIEDLYCEWANEIYRIDYAEVFVSKERKISGATERAIYAQPEVWFRAKSRSDLESVISFENQDDDSVWQFLFGGEQC